MHLLHRALFACERLLWKMRSLNEKTQPYDERDNARSEIFLEDMRHSSSAYLRLSVRWKPWFRLQNTWLLVITDYWSTHLLLARQPLVSFFGGFPFYILLVFKHTSGVLHQTNHTFTSARWTLWSPRLNEDYTRLGRFVEAQIKKPNVRRNLTDAKLDNRSEAHSAGNCKCVGHQRPSHRSLCSFCSGLPGRKQVSYLATKANYFIIIEITQR